MKLGILVGIFASAVAVAATSSSVKMLQTSHGAIPQNVQDQLQTSLAQMYAGSHYREIRTQLIYDQSNAPDHLLVYLHAKNTHRVDFDRIDLDSSYHFKTVTHHYQLQKADQEQQPGPQAGAVQCPDTSVEVITFAPNQDDTELGVTNAVTQAAQSHNFKTVTLLTDQATRANYLNYMSCPNLKGNFYDGDANPSVIATSDGEISNDDIAQYLSKSFRFKVTNIWVACEAFNDPLLTTVRDTAQSQKYAAGVNDLDVGPSDNAAACAMEAAFTGQDMKSAFDACVKKYDNSEDQWGWDGQGSDTFGQ